MSSVYVLVVLGHVQYASSWHSMGVEIPKLLPVTDVKFPALLFAVMRSSASSEQGLALCRDWISKVGLLLDAAFPTCLKDDVPNMSLPEDFDLDSNKKAFRGDGKMVLLLNKFLCRHQGFSRAQDVMLRDRPLLPSFFLSGCRPQLAVGSGLRACREDRCLWVLFQWGTWSRCPNLNVVLRLPW